MKVLHLIRRTHLLKDKLLCPAFNELPYLYREKSTNGSSSSSDSSSDSDSDDSSLRPKTDLKTKNDETLNKLNSLLQQLIEKDVVAKSSKLDLAKPTNKRVKKDASDESEKMESKEKNMVKVVKNVAQELGGDVRQTESELLAKLLNPPSILESSVTLSEIVKGMKIDREPMSKEQSKADQVRGILQRVYSKHGTQDPQNEKKIRKATHPRQRQEMVIQNIDLFGSEPLGIFTNKDALKDVPGNKTWQALYERDLKLSITHPPSNYFQQMILWTEQGKLWKFPIDNEQGLDEENKVYFAKHVFLEEHLEPWCPPRGPIRHFMELVCVGLSKNPYLTVEAKKEHIEWYKNYFEDKRKLLQEVGAFPVENAAAQKTLE